MIYTNVRGGQMSKWDTCPGETIVQGGQMSKGDPCPGGHMSCHLSEGLMSRGPHDTTLFYLSEETFDNQLLSIY